MWREEHAVFTQADGTSWVVPDMDIVFSLKSEAPNLNELRWLVDSLIDCHVAAQTLMPAKEYTGDRIPYDELALLVERPCDAHLEKARSCSRRTKAGLRRTFFYMDYAAMKFDAETGNVEPFLASEARRFAASGLDEYAGEEWWQDPVARLACARSIVEAEWRRGRL